MFGFGRTYKSESIDLLGRMAKDTITGFEGVIVVVSEHSANCDRVGIQSRELSKDGEPPRSHFFDLPQVKVGDKTDIPVAEIAPRKFKLEDEVKCKYTSFKGTIIGYATWITGCNRVAIQSAGMKDGIPVEEQWYAEGHVELIKESPPQAPERKVGGPMRDPMGVRNPR